MRKVHVNNMDIYSMTRSSTKQFYFHTFSYIRKIETKFYWNKMILQFSMLSIELSNGDAVTSKAIF